MLARKQAMRKTVLLLRERTAELRKMHCPRASFASRCKKLGEKLTMVPNTENGNDMV